MLLHRIRLVSLRLHWHPAKLVHLGAVLDPLYTRLPTGAVKPYGWALDMAQVQANGLASQQPVWFS